MSEELKPCPFCGGIAGIENGPPELWYTSCRNPDCLVDGKIMHSEHDAIEVWNRRAPPAVTAKPDLAAPVEPQSDAVAFRAHLKRASEEVAKWPHWKRLDGAAPVEKASAEPNLTPLDYRAQGREEALAIILGLDAEEGLDPYISDSANGDCGDYSSHWDESALRELFSIGDRKHDAYDRAEAMYWEAMGRCDEADRMRLMTERAPHFKPLHDFLAKHHAWDLMHDLQRAAEDPPSAASIPPLQVPEPSPESVRDAAAQRLLRAAKVYTFNYLQDEHEEPELCTCGPKQHAELAELFSAISAMEGKAQ